MESQPQNPEFRVNPEDFHPCVFISLYTQKSQTFIEMAILTGH